MILEFIMNRLTRYEIVKIMTNNVYCKASQIRKENNQKILSTNNTDLTII